MQDRKIMVKKYVLNRAKGLNKAESARRAGYADQNHTGQIEKSEVYQELAKRYFKDDLLEKISKEEIADKLKRNITQDKDLGASNQAIKIALERVEPDIKAPEDENDKVVVILKG